MRESLIEFAKVIKKASELREESFDNKAAEMAKKRGNKFIDFEQFYRLTIDDSIKLSLSEQLNIKPELYPFIWPYLSYLLSKGWNDTNSWAEYVLDKLDKKEGK